MKKISKTSLFLFFALLTVKTYAQDKGTQSVVYSEKQQKLRITVDDIKIYETYGKDNGGVPVGEGYHLFIKKKPGIESVLLTETTKDPEGKVTNYAYRTEKYNPINGDELRYLDGKELVSEGAKYSLIDSTVEKTDFFAEAFHIYIPKKIKYGYEWGRNGEVEVVAGTFINIRAFEKPYADYSGDFIDNPFMFDFQKKKKEKTVTLADNYSPQANITFKELSPDVIYTKGPETLIKDIQKVIQGFSTKDDCDLIFAIDGTGSMKDDINQIKNKLVPMLQKEFEKNHNVRIGLLFYRDYGDNYNYMNLPVKIFDFTDNYSLFSKNLNSIKIIGTEGGDVPEAVYEALYAAEEFFDWNLDSKKHIILMGDAPAHETPKGTKKYTSELVMSRAQQKNIDIHCILLPME